MTNTKQNVIKSLDLLNDEELLSLTEKFIDTFVRLKQTEAALKRAEQALGVATEFIIQNCDEGPAGNINMTIHAVLTSR